MLRNDLPNHGQLNDQPLANPRRWRWPSGHGGQRPRRRRSGHAGGDSTGNNGANPPVPAIIRRLMARRGTFAPLFLVGHRRGWSTECPCRRRMGLAVRGWSRRSWRDCPDRATFTPKIWRDSQYRATFAVRVKVGSSRRSPLAGDAVNPAIPMSLDLPEEKKEAEPAHRRRPA